MTRQTILLFQTLLFAHAATRLVCWEDSNAFFCNVHNTTTQQHDNVKRPSQGDRFTYFFQFASSAYCVCLGVSLLCILSVVWCWLIQEVKLCYKGGYVSRCKEIGLLLQVCFFYVYFLDALCVCRCMSLDICMCVYEFLCWCVTMWPPMYVYVSVWSCVYEFEYGMMMVDAGSALLF